jgi:hypothetical protein
MPPHPQLLAQWKLGTLQGPASCSVMRLWSVAGPEVIRSRLHAMRVSRAFGFANCLKHAVLISWILKIPATQ